MKTDKDYQINEENDTGEEHAKLVLSRLVQNPDKSVNEIIKDVVPTEINEMLRYALKRYVNETLNKESQHNHSSDGEEKLYPELSMEQAKELVGYDDKKEMDASDSFLNILEKK